jgi:voltage-gated potassium channel
MATITTIRKILIKYFIELRWHSIFLGIALYILLSWVFLSLSGEQQITQGSHFIYWIMVTASTVGYGDFSPETTAGKYVAALFVIPFGLSLFGLVIGRVAAFVSHHWRKGVKGLKTLHYQKHILIIGWNGSRTLRLLSLLLKETQHTQSKQKIALCVVADIENPLPDQIGFVKTSSFTNVEGMNKASISEASCIIIDNPQDDITMTTALFCAQQNPDAHIIAYFKDEQLGQLLKNHCPNVECTPSVATEMLAKSAMDPGSSVLHQQLLDSSNGMTQYSMFYDHSQDASFEKLFLLFKNQYNATLIGISNKNLDTVQVNPSLEHQVNSGSILYYIASERITDVNWL